MSDKLFLLDSNREYSYKQLADARRDKSPGLLREDDLFSIVAGTLGAFENGNKIILAPRSIADSEVEKAVQTSAAPKPRGSEGMIGIFTSGTTGTPKLIWHTAPSLEQAVRTGEKHASDVWGLTYSPTSFAALQVILQAVRNQNTLVNLFGMSTEEIRKSIDSCSITHLSATPTFANLLCDGIHQHASVTSFTLGGERVLRRLLEQLRSTFPNARFRNIYASSEAGSLLIAEDNCFEVPPALGEKIRVVNDELEIHTSLLAASLQHANTSEFYPTGDLVKVLKGSPLTFKFSSRRSEWINVGGAKVDPIRIEEKLLQIAGIREARVYGKSNSVTGQIVCCDLVVLPDSTLNSRSVRTHLNDILARHEIPQLIQFVDRIATTTAGKTSRQASEA
ncbi:MAG: class I adenylate-forming enzyme family protein [Planctomycetota bacterium]|nr:class I adenylate-forming enzyme family protein [Planctomycetota bacterium]